jgi:hypothetical protein
MVLYLIIFWMDRLANNYSNASHFSHVTAIKPLVEQALCPFQSNSKQNHLVGAVCLPLFARRADSVIWTCGIGFLLGIDSVNTKGSIATWELFSCASLPASSSPPLCNESQTEDAYCLFLFQMPDGRPISEGMSAMLFRFCFDLFEKL